jgi:hypothetical protein
VSQVNDVCVLSNSNVLRHVRTREDERVNNTTALVLMLVIISVPRHQIKLLKRKLARDVGCVIHQRTNLPFPVNIVEMDLVLTLLLRGWFIRI